MPATLGLPFSARITHDSAVMGGQPCIRGMRVTVGMILGRLATGETTADLLAAFPYLESADIDAALDYAAWRVTETESEIPR